MFSGGVSDVMDFVCSVALLPVSSCIHVTREGVEVVVCVLEGRVACGGCSGGCSGGSGGGGGCSCGGCSDGGGGGSCSIGTNGS